MIKVLLEKLKEKNIQSEDIEPYIDKIENKHVSFLRGVLSGSKEIIDFLVKKGLSVAQSSGIAGNIFIESGFKTDLIGDGGTSYGLAQWHNTRWNDLKKFSEENNYDLNSIKSQMEFLWHELTSTYKSVYNNLKNTDNAADAATIFASGYERPLSDNYTERIKHAINFYKKYTGKDVSYNEKESTKGDKNSPTEKRKSKNYLVYKPDNFKGGEAHVLFAGLHSNQNGQISLNESFYGSGVDPIKGKVLVVITHWGTTVEEAIKHVKDNYNATVTSIAGFSKGGMKMWDYVGPRSNMKFVGLIDPSPEGQGQGISPYINLDFGANTYMTCNWKNWGNKPPGYVPSEVLKWYCDHKDDSKYNGKVICTDKDNYDHSEIFKNFYKKFADKI
jgi:hypothetical protein